jgi:hypothetical protein
MNSTTFAEVRRVQANRSAKSLLDYLWRIVTCAFVFSFGLVASRIGFFALGVVVPRTPEQADESVAVYYLLAGAILLSLGLAPAARRIAGRYWTRAMATAAFLLFCFGIGNSLESSIYSRADGHFIMLLVFLLPLLLFSLMIARLFDSRSPGKSFGLLGAGFFEGRSFVQWTGRLLLCIAAFPLVYFIFGTVVSPIVLEYYKQGVSNLALPGVGSIILIQLLRSLLFLCGSLPLMIVWSGSRIQLVIPLGLAFFAVVYGYDLVLANQYPLVLRVTHGVEILADSFVYSWLLVKLLDRATGEAKTTTAVAPQP